MDELINKKSGADYLKLIADLEEAKSGIKLAEQTIVRMKKEKETNLEGINRAYCRYEGGRGPGDRVLGPDPARSPSTARTSRWR